jgi:hypothetical protein
MNKLGIYARDVRLNLDREIIEIRTTNKEMILDQYATICRKASTTAIYHVEEYSHHDTITVSLHYFLRLLATAEEVIKDEEKGQIRIEV